MRDLMQAIPDADVLLALAPEELGHTILQLVLKREGQRQFNPGNYALEIDTMHEMPPGYPLEKKTDVVSACTEAWSSLERQGLVVPVPGFGGQNGWRVFSRQGREVAKGSTPISRPASQLLPKSSLHPSIADKVWGDFVRGQYGSAVFEAMKQVEIAVRVAGGYGDDAVGVDLMRAAFHPDKGPLTDKSVVKGEREARGHLFAGAIGSYRNSHGHRNVGLTDPSEAAETIMLANLLLRIVDARVKAGNIAT